MSARVEPYRRLGSTPAYVVGWGLDRASRRLIGSHIGSGARRTMDGGRWQWVGSNSPSGMSGRLRSPSGAPYCGGTPSDAGRHAPEQEVLW